MSRATRVTTAVMGALMGLAGVEHGVGEILQGNVAAGGVMIRSWPGSPFFQSLNGEPALTVLPNLLLTGILAVLFSLLFLGWTIIFSPHRRSGPGMMLLAIPMLLFGGGIFPPLMGFLIGAAAAWIPAEIRRNPPGGLKRAAGRGWPWIFAACCAAWLALFPGAAVLGYFFGIDDTGLLLGLMAAAFGLLGLALYSGAWRDWEGKPG